MKWDGKVPFVDGKPVVYVDWRGEHWSGGPVEWRDNEPFMDTLHYTTYSRGRSAARIVFSSETLGASVEMFMVDFDDVATKMSHGCITGMVRFVKRGQNFGVRVVPG